MTQLTRHVAVMPSMKHEPLSPESCHGSETSSGVSVKQEPQSPASSNCSEMSSGDFMQQQVPTGLALTRHWPYIDHTLTIQWPCIDQILTIHIDHKLTMHWPHTDYLLIIHCLFVEISSLTIVEVKLTYPGFSLSIKILRATPSTFDMPIMLMQLIFECINDFDMTNISASSCKV